jgi:putative transcriptional regulator
MTIREQLSMNLARFRVLAGLSQKTAAERLDTKPTTISSWERGVSQPSADMLVKIAMLYKVSLSDLCGADYNQQFTPEETEIIIAYRKSSDSDKQVIRRILGIQ